MLVRVDILTLVYIYYVEIAYSGRNHLDHKIYIYLHFYRLI